MTTGLSGTCHLTCSKTTRPDSTPVRTFLELFCINIAAQTITTTMWVPPTSKPFFKPLKKKKNG